MVGSNIVLECNKLILYIIDFLCYIDSIYIILEGEDNLCTTLKGDVKFIFYHKILALPKDKITPLFMKEGKDLPNDKYLVIRYDLLVVKKWF